MRTKLACISSSSTDLFEIAQLEQILEVMFFKKTLLHTKILNKTSKYAMDSLVALKFTKIDKESVRVWFYVISMGLRTSEKLMM